MLALFLLEVAASNHKTQCKEAEDKRVFFWFGDDLAVDGDSNLGTSRRKIAGAASTLIIIEGSRKEVANRFVNQARSHPRKSLSAPIKQVGRLDANAQTIPIIIRILVHKQAGDSAGASAGDGEGRRVGGAGGKSDVGLASAGNAGQHRVYVCGIGAGKQGRKRWQLVVGTVGVVQVARKGKRVSPVKISAASDAGGAGVVGRAAAAKHPEGLVGWVILAGIDMNEQLRVRYPPPPAKQATTANKENVRLILMYCFIMICQKFLCF